MSMLHKKQPQCYITSEIKISTRQNTPATKLHILKNQEHLMCASSL